MAPKRANPKADEAAKAALLAARKGKALVLTQSTHEEPTEDNVPHTGEDDTFRTCGTEGQSMLHNSILRQTRLGLLSLRLSVGSTRKTKIGRAHV